LIKRKHKNRSDDSVGMQLEKRLLKMDDCYQKLIVSKSRS